MRWNKGVALLAGVLLLLPGLVWGDARQWQGRYEADFSVPGEQWWIELTDCDADTCHLEYQYQGFHACQYSTRSPDGLAVGTPLGITGNQGVHQFDDPGEGLSCRLSVDLRQEGLDRWLTITEAGQQCSIVGGCGARAGIAKGLRLLNVRSRPGFNCLQASTPMEQLICSDVTLGELDARLGEQYFQILAELNAADGNVLRTAQRAWLSGGRNICLQQKDPLPCLQTAYQQRLAVLDAHAEYQHLMRTFPWPAMPDFMKASGFEQLLFSAAREFERSETHYPRFLAFLTAVGVPEQIITEIRRPNAWMAYFMVVDMDLEVVSGQYGGDGQEEWSILVDPKTGLWIYTQFDDDRVLSNLWGSVLFNSQGLSWLKLPDPLMQKLKVNLVDDPLMLPVKRSMPVHASGQVCFWGDAALDEWQQRLSLPGFKADLAQRLASEVCQGASGL